MFQFHASPRSGTGGGTLPNGCDEIARYADSRLGRLLEWIPLDAVVRAFASLQNHHIHFEVRIWAEPEVFHSRTEISVASLQSADEKPRRILDEMFLDLESQVHNALRNRKAA